MNQGLLYKWPEAARFGRIVPKGKIYERASVSSAVRELFASQILQITWAYKLAPVTLKLREGGGVSEIQVFEIAAKGAPVSDKALAAIDRAVKFPIIYEITGETDVESSVRMTATVKPNGKLDTQASTYFSTRPGPAKARRPLPTASDMSALYSGLIAPLLPVEKRPNEELPDAVERARMISRTNKQIEALKNKLRSEPQFNRKVELNRQIRELTAAGETLAGDSPSDSVPRTVR